MITDKVMRLVAKGVKVVLVVYDEVAGAIITGLTMVDALLLTVVNILDDYEYSDHVCDDNCDCCYEECSKTDEDCDCPDCQE